MIRIERISHDEYVLRDYDRTLHFHRAEEGSATFVARPQGSGPRRPSPVIKQEEELLLLMAQGGEADREIARCKALALQEKVERDVYLNSLPTKIAGYTRRGGNLEDDYGNIAFHIPTGLTQEEITSWVRDQEEGWDMEL